MPGAFTPTCSAKHLPGFRDHADDFKAKGVDAIACVSVNDVFVMGAWAKDQNVGENVMLLADGNGDFTKADRARARRLQVRHGRPLAALFHGGGRRQGRHPERGGRRRLQGFLRRLYARADLAGGRSKSGPSSGVGHGGASSHRQPCPPRLSAETCWPRHGIESVVFDTAAGTLWPGAIPHRLMIDERDLWRAGHVLRDAGEEGDS